MGNGEQMNGVMNRSKKRAGIWRTLRLWLPSVLMFCVVAGTMLSIFLSLRATVWCYFTDDVSVRENALDTRVRMVLWEEPYRAPGEVGKLCDSHGLAFSPNGGTVVFGQNVVGQAGGSTKIAAQGWRCKIPAGFCKGVYDQKNSRAGKKKIHSQQGRLRATPLCRYTA